jgi:hypothetical protein
MAKQPKTDAELIGDIRQAALAIRDASDEIPLLGSMTIAEIQLLESLGSALAIFCKLLRHRLDVGPSAAVEHLRVSLEGE